MKYIPGQPNVEVKVHMPMGKSAKHSEPDADDKQPMPVTMVPCTMNSCKETYIPEPHKY